MSAALYSPSPTEDAQTMSLDAHYSELEERFPLSDGADYERLVVPQGSAYDSVHRWFHMKEAYSPHLLPRVLKDVGLTEQATIRLHDPFLGSGTTLASALMMTDGPVAEGSGSEINPFLAMLSSAKLSALSLKATERLAIAAEAERQCEQLFAAARRSGRPPSPPLLPAFADGLYFPRQELAQLLRMRSAWTQLEPSLCRDLLGIALAACVEPCSYLRRDGRALRYEPNKQIELPISALQRRVTNMAEDLRVVQPRGTALVHRGSALDSASWPATANSVDLICFSPPYPNNIDYTEVYKLEAWFLELIQSREGFRAQRRATMRSHPSVIFPSREWTDVPHSVSLAARRQSAALVAAVPHDRYRSERIRVIEGYVADAAVALWRSHQALREGGHAVYIVGNSRHGKAAAGYTIASDVLLAALSQEIGFEVQELKVARRLRRRGAHEHLRESVGFLQKRTA